MKKILLATTVCAVLLNAGEYEDWLKQQNAQYSNYKKSMDEEFASMLKADWKAFKLMSEPSVYKKPKPTKIPKVTKTILPKNELKKSPKVKVQKLSLQPIQKVPKIIKTSVIDPNIKIAKIDFYNQKIEVPYDKNMLISINRIDKNSISKYWEEISKTNYKSLIKEINSISNRLNLNDWAKYKLVYKIGVSIYQDENLSNLFTWFILTKNNYDIKVGYKSDKIYLLSTTKNKLYQVAFFTLKGKKYYVITPNGRVNSIGAVYTYKQNYPKANKKLSFDIKHPIKLYNDIKSKQLSFVYNNKKYNIDVQYSKDLIDFYKTFPQSDYKVYFDSKKSPLLSKSLLTQLQNIIANKTELEAANILLRFTQTAFRYKTDPQQFHYEKVLFPEETIYYPYSDCEDRSIMFSYLVKNLLHLDIIGLKYSDHLATAVKFNSIVNGDVVLHNGSRYVVSDPTYINANVGMAMPKYKKAQFKVISVN